MLCQCFEDARSKEMLGRAGRIVVHGPRLVQLENVSRTVLFRMADPKAAVVKLTALRKLGAWNIRRCNGA